MFCLFPIQTYLYQRDRKKNGGVGRPEARFLTSLYAVWVLPAALFWFAYTSNGQSSIWSPIIAGTFIGIVNPLLWLAELTYVLGKPPSPTSPLLETFKLTFGKLDTYPHVCASAVAAMLIPSNVFAAGCSHFGIFLFDRYNSTMAITILGGISFGLPILINGIYFFGHRIRFASKRAFGSKSLAVATSRVN